MSRKRTLALAGVAAAVLVVALAPVASASNRLDPPVVHIVRPGDTLYSIARYYGVDMWTIARANNIVNPNRIYVGQRLVIPSGGTTGVVHVVQRGETLSRIAVRYGVTVWAIARANGIYNPNYIWVGQRLVIPGVGYPPPSPPPPSTGPWYGEYFNDLSMTAPPCLTRNDAGVNFNWGWGSPAGVVPADNFAVRWTRTFNYAGGTYRFYARVDDGVRVWVDGVLIIDGWRDGALRIYKADRWLAAGQHDLRVEYYERTQVARIHFWWERVAAPTVTPTPTPSPAPTGAWHGVFYNNAYLLEPSAGEADTAEIDFWWATGSPNVQGVRSDYFSVRWTRSAYFDAGTYGFHMQSDDGGRVWVDGALVIDEWHLSPAHSYYGERSLSAGYHTVVVEYFEWSDNALIHVWWERK